MCSLKTWEVQKAHMEVKQSLSPRAVSCCLSALCLCVYFFPESVLSDLCITQ